MKKKRTRHVIHVLFRELALMQHLTPYGMFKDVLFGPVHAKRVLNQLHENCLRLTHVVLFGLVDAWEDIEPALQ